MSPLRACPIPHDRSRPVPAPLVAVPEPERAGPAGRTAPPAQATQPTQLAQATQSAQAAQATHSAQSAPPAIIEPGVPPLTHRLVGAVAVFAFEAVEGTRLVGQLGTWITARVARELQALRALNLERRALYRDGRRVVPCVRRVRTSRLAPCVAEAAVVLSTAARSRAVALRFEAIRGQWRATSITVL